MSALSSSSKDAMPARKRTDSAIPDAASKKIRSMWENRAFTDAEVVCGDRTWNIHRAQLASSSEVFRKMFESEMMEGRTCRLEIKDSDPEIVEELLQFVYMCSCPSVPAGANDNVPSCIKVTAPDITHGTDGSLLNAPMIFTGTYELVESQTANGSPVWRKSHGNTGRWLYMGSCGRWLLAHEHADVGLGKNFSTNAGWFYAVPKTKSQMPQCSNGSWFRYDGAHGKHIADHDVCLSAPADEEQFEKCIRLGSLAEQYMVSELSKQCVERATALLGNINVSQRFGPCLLRVVVLLKRVCKSDSELLTELKSKVIPALPDMNTDAFASLLLSIA